MPRMLLLAAFGAAPSTALCVEPGPGTCIQRPSCSAGLQRFPTGCEGNLTNFSFIFQHEVHGNLTNFSFIFHARSTCSVNFQNAICIHCRTQADFQDKETSWSWPCLYPASRELQMSHTNARSHEGPHGAGRSTCGVKPAPQNIGKREVEKEAK